MGNHGDLLCAARDLGSVADLDGGFGFTMNYCHMIRINGHALHDLGVLMIRRSDFGRSAELLEQALASHPSDPACHVDLGEAYRNLGKYQDAAGCCLIGA